MMVKQCLINRIISKNLHFTAEKEDSSHEDETWIEVETLQEYNEKIDKLFDEILGDANGRQDQE